jgi:hypothetical protein
MNRPILQQHEFRAPFTEGNIERQQDHADIHPGGEPLDRNQEHPSGDAHQEERRHGQDIHERNVFEGERIGQVQTQVDGDQQDEGRFQEPCRRNGDDRQDDGGGGRRRYGQSAGGDRAAALDGVQPVLFAIGDIVHQVHRAGRQAQQDEARDRPQQGFGLEELPVEYQGGEEENILRPLPRAKAFDQGDDQMHAGFLFANIPAGFRKDGSVRQPAFPEV